MRTYEGERTGAHLRVCTYGFARTGAHDGAVDVRRGNNFSNQNSRSSSLRSRFVWVYSEVWRRCRLTEPSAARMSSAVRTSSAARTSPAARTCEDTFQILSPSSRDGITIIERPLGPWMHHFCPFLVLTAQDRFLTTSENSYNGETEDILMKFR